MDTRMLTSFAVVLGLILVGVVGFVLLRDDEPTEQPEPAPTPDDEVPPDDRPSDDAAAVPEDDVPADDELVEEEAPPRDPQPVVEAVAEGFEHPWSLAFLPDGRLVVTQAPGVLSLVDAETGVVTDVDDVPEVDTRGQGGLLDVAVAPDFTESQWLYLTYSAGDGTGATTTHLARGRLNLEAERLEDVEVLFVAAPFLQSSAHYGSRVEFDHEGYLFMTIGDRGDKNFADHVSQDTTQSLGSTIRLTPDGSVPEDNPFVNDPDVVDEIYSYGHRNAQGMAVHPTTGEVWLSEHGERDGDELNVIEAGGNYGWPETHTGCEYGTDTPVGQHPSERADVVDPVFYWECNTGGFPPAGMAFYTGDEFPAWEGDLLVGGLASQHLARFTVDGRTVEEAEALLPDEGWRIRDVAVGPEDGAIYIAIDAADVPLVRLVDGAEG